MDHSSFWLLTNLEQHFIERLWLQKGSRFIDFICMHELVPTPLIQNKLLKLKKDGPYFVTLTSKIDLRKAP